MHEDFMKIGRARSRT